MSAATFTDQRTMGSRLSSLGKILDYAHYVGMVVVVLIYLQARHVVQRSDNTLAAVTEKQESLRTLLWENLLIQRATNLAFEGKIAWDHNYFDRAETVSSSLNSTEFGPANSWGSSEISREVTSDIHRYQAAQEALQSSVERGSNLEHSLKSLFATTD